MFVKQTDSIASFIAKDNTIIKELLHPHKESIDLAYSLAEGSLGTQKNSVNHQLIGHSETYFFLSGQGEIVVEGECKIVCPGTIIHVPPSAKQYLINTGKSDLKFLCIVSPPWEEKNDIPLSE